METKYFTRKIAEGTVIRKHKCSFDPAIELTYLSTSCKKVVDLLILRTANAGESVKTEDKVKIAKESFVNNLANLRINGLPIVYEDFVTSFTQDEAVEIIGFVNNVDMTQFGGEETGSEEKNG